MTSGKRERASQSVWRRALGGVEASPEFGSHSSRRHRCGPVRVRREVDGQRPGPWWESGHVLGRGGCEAVEGRCLERRGSGNLEAMELVVPGQPVTRGDGRGWVVGEEGHEPGPQGTEGGTLDAGTLWSGTLDGEGDTAG